MRRHAFSLVELLIVVAIIALFVAVLLPALARARMAPRHHEGIMRVYADAPGHPVAHGDTNFPVKLAE